MAEVKNQLQPDQPAALQIQVWWQPMNLKTKSLIMLKNQQKDLSTWHGRKWANS